MVFNVLSFIGYVIILFFTFIAKDLSGEGVMSKTTALTVLSVLIFLEFVLLLFNILKSKKREIKECKKESEVDWPVAYMEHHNTPDVPSGVSNPARKIIGEIV